MSGRGVYPHMGWLDGSVPPPPKFRVFHRGARQRLGPAISAAAFMSSRIPSLTMLAVTISFTSAAPVPINATFLMHATVATDLAKATLTLGDANCNCAGGSVDVFSNERVPRAQDGAGCIGGCDGDKYELHSGGSMVKVSRSCQDEVSLSMLTRAGVFTVAEPTVLGRWRARRLQRGPGHLLRRNYQICRQHRRRHTVLMRACAG